jgi:histone-lysine N-methyltransferase SETMAR
MDKIEYRTVIKFSVKEGLTPNEIHSKFIKVYGNSSPSFSIIKKWDLHHELLEHPPYSPDLALSDFYLFSKLKLFLAGQRSSSNQETIAAVGGYFADLTKHHYRDGIMVLEHRWNKCISLKGDYVEK